MRLPSLFRFRAASLWAGIAWTGPVLAIALVICVIGPASANAAPGAHALAVPQAPTGTIIDADIVTDTVWTLAGSPYQIVFASSGFLVETGVVLTVEPGVEVQFSPNASLIVEGTLKAIGTTAQPILFTGVDKTPGSWLFLVIQGDLEARNQGSVLRHVTIEYAQWNLMLSVATAHLSDCILRNASEVGLWGFGAGGTVVERCQIVGNGTYGLENALGGLMLAANNYWGSASGPYHEGCNPTGTGDTIEDSYGDGVVFRPFLTAPDQAVAPVVANEMLSLAVAPQRWFAPADGVSLIPVALTLRDGTGHPLSGRTVCLTTDLGTAGGCGITGADGETLAYVTSDTPGDATLTGLYESGDACFLVNSSEALVTFVEEAGDALLPGEAPYMNGQIEIVPKPIIGGVPSTVQAKLMNPNDTPIEVNVTFSYARYGIGVGFGPLGGVEDVRIEPQSERVVGVPWTPPFSGHICLRVDYVAQPVSRSAADLQTATGGGQTNFTIEPGPMGDPGTEEDAPPDEQPPEGEEEDPESKPQMAQKAKAAMDQINNGQMVIDAISEPGNIPGMAIPNALFSAIMDFNLESWSTATAALAQDPPRQDYDVYAIQEHYSFTPLVPSDDPYLSPARAKAGNLLMTSMLTLTAELRAAAISLDRYAGASNAGDVYWASEQAGMLLYYEQQAGVTMLETADRIDDLLSVMTLEGVKDLIVQVPTVIAYQTRLATSGFNRTELNAAAMIGMTSDEIEAERQARIAADPKDLAGSVMTRLTDVAERLRRLAPLLIDPPTFDMGDGGMVTAASTASTNLARVFTSRTAFQIANPLPEAAIVELRVRRLDLPSDWMVSVSPQSVDLEPGEVVTGTVRIRPGLATVQGTQPRVAVEGTIDGELIGGVVVEVMVPKHVVAGPKQRVFLPLTLRD